MGYFLKEASEIFKKKGILALLTKVFVYPARVIYAVYACYVIRYFTGGYSLEELVDFEFSSCRGLIRPFQVKSELKSFISVVAGVNPRVVVEIGTATGGSLFLFCRAAVKEGCIISIDLPAGEFGGGYPFWKTFLYRSFIRSNQKLYLIRRDSKDLGTLEKVLRILKGDKIDVLYIDGDHSYEGVKRDFKSYSALVRQGGLIAFHDINILPAEPGCEVNKFWEEIKNNYRYDEIISDRDKHGSGVGVLHV